MKKKNIVIIAIIIGIFVAIAIGVAIFNGSKKEANKTQHTKEDSLVEEKDENVEETEEVKTEEVKTEEDTVTEEETTQVVFDESAAVSVWTTSNLNLRQQADGNSAVITVISKGTEIKKSAEENGWAYVKCGENIGYVSTKYISDTKPEEKVETPTETETPTEAVASTTKVEAIPGQRRDPNNIVVVIDPGHQLRGDNTKEPNGPGSSVMKARVTSGTTGVATGVAEYILNLDVSLKLKTELENRGYTVYMTRSVHEINISNKERAEYATSVNADIAVRIHGNGSTNPSVCGAETYGPSASNPYVSHLSNASMSLSRCIIDAYCAATGFKNRGARTSDTMTGINWSSVPVTIVELGYMSNAEEDRKMQDAAMQNNMVQGIANGIDAYFGL